MRPETKERIREDIRLSLLNIVFSRSALSGFGNSATAVARTRYRDDTGRTKVKVPIVHAPETRCRPSSSMPLHPSAFKFSKINRALKSINKAAAQWLIFCYGDDECFEIDILLIQIYTIFALKTKERLKYESREVLERLILLACAEKRKQINTDERFLSQKEIAKLVGKEQKAWEKTWSRRWHTLLDIVDGVDAEAINHVCEYIRKEQVDAA
jgi:hypothetical protein